MKFWHFLMATIVFLVCVYLFTPRHPQTASNYYVTDTDKRMKPVDSVLSIVFCPPTYQFNHVDGSVTVFYCTVDVRKRETYKLK